MSEQHSHTSVTVLAVALLGFALFQMTQIFADRDNLHKAKTQVEAAITQADKVLTDNQKMLDQLNAIAIGTQRLADSGNANAKEIVTQLGRLGIKINPNFKEGDKNAKPGEGAAPAGGPPSAAGASGAATPAAEPAPPAEPPAPAPKSAEPSKE